MKHVLTLGAGLLLLASCTREISEIQPERSGSLAKKEIPMFSEIGSIDIGDEGAAEISAFDPLTNKLFVVNNTDGNNRIDVLDLSDPASPNLISSIPVAPYGGLVNSVSVSNGKLAAAIEANIKTDNGKIVVLNTTDYSLIASVTVGAQPDMVTFSPDGTLIISANEGEPDEATYTIDPEGSVSIIAVNEGYAVTTLNFAGFESQKTALMAKGFRIFGPNASFAQDIEPEYVAVAANSKTAWVSLQENNAIAKIDLEYKVITDILPLGFKDYSLAENAVDLSDKDGYNPGTWPVKGVYMPDGIAVFTDKNVPYVFSANEGDAREWGPYIEPVRVKSVVLDLGVFPNRTDLQKDGQLGRLNITKAMGDTDNDGDYDELYSFGARSFSIWNGNTGAQVFDSKNELDKVCVDAGVYDDGRSDDKSVEPEGVVLGKVGNSNLLFVGMERADAVAVYNVSNPNKPVFLQLLKCGDAPEGVLFVPASESPNGRALLIVSSENDGQVKIYATPVQ